MIVRSLLYIIAVILFVGWGIGYFLWRPGPMIHIMVLLALVFFILGLSRKQGIR
ncbi:MAG: lmo0937 family membrane protein [Taibaiella sp.]|nr:lmo0937 family membrane protein [Taibaiella sp.]